jgi:uncharacterized membrane protein YozB (DUF420 family)
LVGGIISLSLLLLFEYPIGISVQVGFLGTRAPLLSDLNLVGQFILLFGLSLGVILARRGNYKAHQYMQTTMVLFNLALVLSIMVRSFSSNVVPGLPGKLKTVFGLITTIHAGIGFLAIAFGAYLLLRMNHLLPERMRIKSWKNLMRLLAYATGLEAAASIQANADAIVAHRGLLDEPDPVSPLLDAATNLLRQELNAKLKAYAAEHKRKMEQLEAHEDWQKLSWVQLNQLVEQHQLAPLKTPELHTSALLLDALDDCNLHHWADRIAALSGRFEAARQAATRLLKPNAFHVKLPGRTINNAEELKQWLTEVEALVAEQLKKGPVSL